MMDTTRRDVPDALSAEFTQVIGRFWRWQYGEFSPGDSWSPQVNVYRLPDRFEVCMELAGVQRQTIEVHVEQGRLTIRGVRTAPEPERPHDEPIRIVCMEIDHGSFRRSITLPTNVALERVESVYADGLLWVRLPLIEPGPVDR